MTGYWWRDARSDGQALCSSLQWQSVTVRCSLLHAGPADGLREGQCQASALVLSSFPTYRSLFERHRDVCYNRLPTGVDYYVLCPEYKNEFVVKWYKHPDTSLAGLQPDSVGIEIPLLLQSEPRYLKSSTRHKIQIASSVLLSANAPNLGHVPTWNFQWFKFQVVRLSRPPIRAALISGNSLVTLGHVTSSIRCRHSPVALVIL